jgi:surfeit locus 1 family protein
MRDFLQQPLLTWPLGRRVFAPSRLAVLLAVAGVVLFVSLGRWQLHRAAEKELMMTRYAARVRMAPLTLPGLLRRGADIADFPLQLHGRYDNARTLFLENQSHGEQSGFHVYTPFLPDGDNRYILVNRGWLPRAQDARLLPPVPAAMAAEVTGTVSFPSAFFTVGQTDYRQRPLRVPRLEMAQLSRALGVELRPFVVLLDASAPDGFVREWNPAAVLTMGPDQHRAYAFQWFAMAAAALVMLIVINLRKPS